MLVFSDSFGSEIKKSSPGATRLAVGVSFQPFSFCNAQESAAERHYSLVSNIQSNNRGRIQPESLEKRCLFRAKVLQDIVDSADNVNHGLQTVDEVGGNDRGSGALD